MITTHLILTPAPGQPRNRWCGLMGSLPVMWPDPVARSCDYVSRSHDQFPTVMWPVVVVRKNAYIITFPRSHDRLFSHGYVSFFWWSGDGDVIFSHGHMIWFFLLAGNIWKILKKIIKNIEKILNIAVIAGNAKNG